MTAGITSPEETEVSVSQGLAAAAFAVPQIGARDWTQDLNIWYDRWHTVLSLISPDKMV